MGRNDQRRAERIGTVADARRLARRRLPPAVFDYVDGGAGAEQTMRANATAFEALGFRPSMGADAGVPDLATDVLGRRLALPIVLGPVGYTRLVHPDGDVAGARAAAAAGTAFALSSMSGHRLDEVAATGADCWFQLYLLGGRDGAARLVDQAAAAGYRVLVVTMDSQVPGNRERDGRHGIKFPIRLSPRTMARLGVQVLPHPGWFAGFARGGLGFDLANSVDAPGGPPLSIGDAIASMSASPPTWDDFAWLRERWSGPVVAKGVITVADAKRAVDAGVDGIVVSNHGGRQLDGVAPAVAALAGIVDDVGDQVEVLLDGGVRRGADVARAVALGARAVLIGRPWVYGLAAGEPGVSRVVEVLRDDLARTLRLLGCASVGALDRSFVAPWSALLHGEDGGW